MSEEDDDAYVAEFASRNRRRAGLRLLGVGVLVAAAGGGIYVYGQKLAAEQAHSAVQFQAPDRMSIAGGIALAIGVLLIVPGVILLVRSRRRTNLPAATLRE